MTQLYKLKYSVRKDPGADNLFFGLWMRWQTLTVAERFVCANIIVVPVWWVVGLYKYMPLLLLFGVALYELLQYGGLRLKRPVLPVIALFAFGTYQLVRILLFYKEPRTLTFFDDVVMLSFCPACWLWYIQSNNIRIRKEVVAWACTVSVVQMIGFWFLLQFVLPETLFLPPRLPNLFGLLTRKGLTNANFTLVPYERGDGDAAGLYRFSFFFISPQFFAVVAGFLGLVALEIKNRFWSLLLFLACVFLMFLSATRAVWVAFPIVIGLRYIFSNFGKPSGPPIIFALTAVASFTTLSLPAVTDLFLNTFTNSVQSVDNYRAKSTDARMEIYKQTWESIQENPFWGHMSKGDPISLNGPQYEVVGSHSVILGNLLYLNGVVGTVIFAVFWISLFIWLYKTRSGRPLTCFCMWILYTLVSPTIVTVYEMPISSLLMLLCVATRHPKLKPVQIRNV